MSTVGRDSRAGMRTCILYITIYIPKPYITGGWGRDYDGSRHTVSLVPPNRGTSEYANSVPLAL